MTDRKTSFFFYFVLLLLFAWSVPSVSLCELAVVLIWSHPVLKCTSTDQPWTAPLPFNALHFHSTHSNLDGPVHSKNTTQNHTRARRNQARELTVRVHPRFDDFVVETRLWQSYFQTLKSIEEVCESHAFQHIALAQRSRGRSDVSARLALVLALSKFTIVCLRRPAMRLSVKSGLVVNVTNKRIKQHKWTVRCRLDILKHIRSCV